MSVHKMLVIGTGNPGVFQGYLYPYPQYPHPQWRVQVLAGQGKGLAVSVGIKTLGELQYPWEFSESILH